MSSYVFTAFNVGITIMFEKPISQSSRVATMLKIHSAASSLAANI
jgi:hypothetical protein